MVQRLRSIRILILVFLFSWMPELPAMGCRFAQEFYFYRPMPREEFEQLVGIN